MERVHTVIEGCGRYLPKNVYTNEDMEKIVDTTDEWIQQRSGIKERRFVDKGQGTAEMATAAAREALEEAGVRAEEIDFVIVSTVTGDYHFPSVASMVQEELGLTRAWAYDLSAACAGFVYGLCMADGAVRAGMGKCGLIVGADTVSALLDFTDRSTSVLFGDGAGAVVVRGVPVNGRGIMACALGSDGAAADLVRMRGGLFSDEKLGMLMQGQALFRRAVEVLKDISFDVMGKVGVSQGDIDWFVPHQANLRIIRAVSRAMNFPEERVITTVERHGNTSSASIPLAMYEAWKDGRFKQGDTILLSSVGGGLKWGSVLLRW